MRLKRLLILPFAVLLMAAMGDTLPFNNPKPAFYTSKHNNSFNVTHAAAVTGGGYVVFDSASSLTTGVTLTTSVPVVWGGGTITKTTGSKIHFGSTFDAPLKQVFSGFSAGDVTGTGSITELFPQWFGAKIDGSTDDTTALQLTINMASYMSARPDIVITGHAKFTKLWLNYHATDNPGYKNSTSYADGGPQGNVTIRGIKRMTSFMATTRKGSVLESTDATGPAINIVDPSNLYYSLNLKLKNIALMANNTTYVLSAQGINTSAGLENVYIDQANSAGNGVLWEDSWITKWDDVEVFYSNDPVSASTGTGIIVRNTNSSGGIFSLLNSNIHWFGTEAIFGQTSDTGATLNTVKVQNTQFQAKQRNNITDGTAVIVGKGINADFDTIYIEGSKDRGIWVFGANTTLNIRSSYIDMNADNVTPSDNGIAGILIGHYTTAALNYGAVNAENCYFKIRPGVDASHYYYGIYQKSADTSAVVSARNNVFVGVTSASLNTAIGFAGTGIAILDNNYIDTTYIANKLSTAAGSLTNVPVVKILGHGSFENNDYTSFEISGIAGKVRDLYFSTKGSLRWIVRADDTAESGSNAGSNLKIIARTDAGGTLADRFFINRATGVVGVGTSSAAISDGVGLHINGKILRIGTSKTPANAGDTGNAGEIAWDADYIYVCTATNTWKRAAIATWP